MVGLDLSKVPFVSLALVFLGTYTLGLGFHVGTRKPGVRTHFINPRIKKVFQFERSPQSIVTGGILTGVGLLGAIGSIKKAKAEKA